MASLEQQRKQAEAEYLHKNLDDLTEAQEKASSLHEQLLQAAQKFRLQTLTSPVDGTVQQLAVHTEGGVVTPAQILMSIVPVDSKLEIEAMIPNRDIGFVHVGQEAEIKVDTFTFTRYGLIHGRVLSISQDSIVRENPSNKANSGKRTSDESETSEPVGQELVYSARIAFDQTKMRIEDRLVNLAYGCHCRNKNWLASCYRIHPLSIVTAKAGSFKGALDEVTTMLRFVYALSSYSLAWYNALV